MVGCQCNILHVKDQDMNPLLQYLQNFLISFIQGKAGPRESQQPDVTGGFKSC